MSKGSKRRPEDTDKYREGHERTFRSKQCFCMYGAHDPRCCINRPDITPDLPPYCDTDEVVN